jgi:hypothetical protein
MRAGKYANISTKMTIDLSGVIEEYLIITDCHIVN